MLKAVIRRHLYSVFVTTVLTVTAGIHLADPFFLQALRLLTFDQYARMRPAESDPAVPVRIVDIDDASLARIGQWPWPRSVMANLLNTLNVQGAAVVAFDVMFAESDRNAVAELAKTLPPDRALVLAKLTGDLVSNDQLFAAAIAHAPTVLAVTLTDAVETAAANPAKAGFAVAGDDPKPYVRGFGGYVGNLPPLMQAAGGVGSINWVPDRDGVVRRVPLLYRLNDNWVPSLAAEALRLAQGASSYVIKAANASGETAFGQKGGINHIRIGAYEIPTDADGGLWVNYRHSNRERYLPVWKVLEGQIDRSEIEGKIILVGTSAAGLGDMRATPLDASIPGVEIHAQIMEHVLLGRSLTRPDYAPALELFVLLALGVALAAVFPRVSAASAAWIGVGVVLALLAGGAVLYAQAGLLFDPLYPSVSIFVLAAGSSFYLYRRTEMQRSEIRNAFGQYVSPAVVNQLIAQPEKLTLGGEMRELTLLFCDVRNFTGISEGLTAVELTAFINSLLTPLSDIVIARNGTIDKYMGDAMMAFWNAPLDDPLHARHACEAAVEIVREIAALNASWRAEAEAKGRRHTEVKLGIGVNTGQCCVGNLGSSLRFDYSAIGDDVNIASRFEGLTKYYGLTMLTGETTLAGLGDFPCLEIDLVRVKGREKPSRLYSPMAILGVDPSQAAALSAAQSRFLACYRAGDWAAAQSALAACREFKIEALRRLYDLYQARLQDLRRSPPANWDGVYTAQEK